MYFDPDHEPRRIAEVQRIFRSYFGEAYSDYAEKIPDLLRKQAELGHRTVLITAEDETRRVLAFALALHYTNLNSTLLDFIVADPNIRQRGVGGALYEALREYLTRLGSKGLYLEARPDDPELERIGGAVAGLGIPTLAVPEGGTTCVCLAGTPCASSAGFSAASTSAG